MKNENIEQPATPERVGVGSKELLACPFCGHTNLTPERRQVSWRHNEGTTIRTVMVCGDCGAQGPAFGHLSITGEKTAANYWNRRHANDKLSRGLPTTKKDTI